MKILIIDHDRDMASFLKERFLEKCVTVDATHNPVEGIRMSKMTTYDLVVTNHKYDTKNHFDICQEIRKQSHCERKHVPIIITSEDHDLNTKLRCFRSGADDFIIKPFFFEELYCRVKAILKRPSIREPEHIFIDDLELDLCAHKVSRNGKSIYLTKKEYSVFEYMMRHAGTILSRGDIVEHVWDIHADPFSNMLEMHILNLRRKINLPGTKPLIHCVVGRGYKIDIER